MARIKKIFTQEELKQIPCPYDHKHTIVRHRLEYHLKRCNARPVERTDPYYKKDINISTSTDASESSSFEIVDLSKEELSKWICLFNRISDSLPTPQKKVLFHPAMNARLEEGTKKKHAIQQASLLGHMEKLHYFDNQGSIYYEFGAGRAELSRYVQHCSQQENVYILIDRDSNRTKHDSRILKDSIKNNWPEPKIIRCKIDIKDLKLDFFASEFRNSGKPVFAYSKHLCGAATDLTLNCLKSSPPNALVIALCCHHHCRWRTLSTFAREQLSHWGISNPQEFQILRQMTGWAVNSLREHMHASGGADSHISGLSHEERVKIGLKCKHIINYMRKLECEKMGYESSLVYYVGEETTLENVALIAYKRIN
ncbi:tRNA:m(4)X modification enzyme TRM13 [Schizosaccharomyces pombe]|uniref:tRNA:m(4)X modification enzyme TRM13 n=1 Tax=Schizosaccharomyces pombe (strain 972 / ATCC 24843) TaxID=284812 RepID=TRM13_SCHPO|nr:putative tRNA 2'-O-methyltransferase Trm13 [Schizosaccharomyces pombe]Q9UTH1.2 RecName: Full=tRNA:m(4)X modification enzyme TRM13; AltName: Full=tRNA methylase 13 [Schizosaccharomyces pombe 972h-]CAB55844.2 tRNA 2'-O-methyltransferase Trm13 (predicted) [Schizosaccharomyces pombe]|eukprot:NP_593914.2 putative tRNA 2'-O-methyltransferase Trm13 [Schizosaccharomyces pombe]